MPVAVGSQMRPAEEHAALARDSISSNSIQDSDEKSTATLPQDQAWWRVTHALAFFIGGVLFLVGTALCVPTAPPFTQFSTLQLRTQWHQL